MQVTPPPASAEDIVVIGRRLKRLSITLKRDHKTGATRCVFKRRSGDLRLDEQVCSAALTCFGHITLVSKAQIQAEMTTCMTSAIATLLPKPQSSADAEAGGHQ